MDLRTAERLLRSITTKLPPPANHRHGLALVDDRFAVIVALQVSDDRGRSWQAIYLDDGDMVKPLDQLVDEITALVVGRMETNNAP
jgi:hypothetical protein